MPANASHAPESRRSHVDDDCVDISASDSMMDTSGLIHCLWPSVVFGDLGISMLIVLSKSYVVGVGINLRFHDRHVGEQMPSGGMAAAGEGDVCAQTSSTVVISKYQYLADLQRFWN